jgi:hypothetical protein
LKVLV